MAPKLCNLCTNINNAEAQLFWNLVWFWLQWLFVGNPGLRHGKPGAGVGVGYGIRVKSPMGHFQVDCALNAFQQKTIYFGFSNVPSWFSDPSKLFAHLDYGWSSWSIVLQLSENWPKSNKLCLQPDINSSKIFFNSL